MYMQAVGDARAAAESRYTGFRRVGSERKLLARCFLEES